MVIILDSGGQAKFDMIDRLELENSEEKIGIRLYRSFQSILCFKSSCIGHRIVRQNIYKTRKKF